MAPIDDDDDAQELLQLQRTQDDMESIVKEMAEHKPDPKLNIEPVFAVTVNGLTHPVSPNEEQMMQLFTQSPLNSAYNLPMMHRLMYPMDHATVLQAINIQVKRHDILRATWHMGESTVPVRRIHPRNHGDAPVYYIEKESDAHAIAIMDNSRPHQLGYHSAHWGVCASRNDRRKQEFESPPFIYVNLHHVIADADGQQSCMMEMDLILLLLFRGFSEQAVMDRLPVLAVQFSDYSYWQHSLQARGLLKPDLAVWFSSITSSYPPMILDLPLDIPRQRIFTAVGDFAKVRMDAELIHVIMEKITTTPYSLVFCNFTIALARLTNQSRVNVAIPYGTRANPSLYPLIGSFLNMLPAQFEYLPSESYGAVLDRMSKIQLDARKYALAPYLTVVNMLRTYYNPIFDPSRNPVYQSMVDMVPGGDEWGGGGLGGVLDIHAFAQAPASKMAMCEVGFNRTLFQKPTAYRMLLMIKTIAYIAANQATQGAHRLYSQRLPRYLPTVEAAHDANTGLGGCLGTFDLKINGPDGDETSVSCVGGFGLKGTPDEYDFIRRTRKFARHSGVMGTTDVGHKYSMQYQIPPKPPKKKGQTPYEFTLPDVEIDANYVKAEANADWKAEDAAPLATDGCQQLEGMVESYDNRSGFGFITCESTDEPIPFFRSALPINSRPTKKQSASMNGRKVAFSYYSVGDRTFATGLRFVEDGPVAG